MIKLARDKAVEDITVKEIVQESGLSLQTFYNHFHSKEDLILWMHRRWSERALSRLTGRRCSFRDLTMDSIRFYAANTGYLRCAFGEGMFNPYAEISAASTYTMLSSFICQRCGFEQLPEELSFYLWMYVYACLHIFSEWSLKGWELPQERLAAYLEQGMPEKLKPYLLN